MSRCYSPKGRETSDGLNPPFKVITNNCEYCHKRVKNKKIYDIDNTEIEFAEIVFLQEVFLKVELDAIDEDGYKAMDYFKINYCPMCGRKLEKYVKKEK